MDLLRPVMQLVWTVAPDAITTGLPGSRSLRLPETRDRQGLITAANGVYKTAKPYEEKLTEAGLPKEHLAKLLAGATALREAIDVRAQNVLQRGAAGGSATAEAHRAVPLVRLIDPLVVPLLRGDGGRLRAWASAKRMGYRGAGSTEQVVDGGGSVPAGGGVTGGAGAPVAGVLSENQTGAAGGAGR